MGTSKKQLLIDAIVARFRTILMADGYSTNLGNNIFLWKGDAFQDAEIPGADIRDIGSNDASEQLSGGAELHTLTIEVRIVAFSNDVARNCQADIVTAIALDRNWGVLAEDTGVVSNSGLAEDTGGEKNYISAIVRFPVEYTTENMNAYV